MPSWVITGVSRGLGWGFLRQVSNDPNNLVIGIVRNKEATEKRIAAELPPRSNIHILQGDLTDYASLKAAAEDTAKITGGTLDYLLANAAFVSYWEHFLTIGEVVNEPEKFEEVLLDGMKSNVIGNIHLFNLFLPLIMRGQAKKVIALTTGHADLELVNKCNLANAPLYAIIKGAQNVAVAKFNAQYAKDGILFLSLSPGAVDTGHMDFDNASEKEKEGMMTLFQKISEIAPHFKGPVTPESAAKDCISIIDKVSLDQGYGGAFISHHGNKHWL